jgi:pyruvate dehydrogenase E2 component (dihydrolipoamide acetyltransferase)
MAQPIVMSSFGSYAAEGKLISWLKPAGARVDVGEAIAEIETEKATYEVEAAAGGILHPVAKPGTDLPLETVIGFLLEEGEAPPEGSGDIVSEVAVEAVAPKSQDPEIQRTQELRASPIAKRLAREHGVDLSGLVGSGPGGRIVEADVMAEKARRATPAAAQGSRRNVRTRLPLTGMRGTIAQRMRHSLATAASLTITREVEAEILVAARKRILLTLGADLPYDALFVKLFADSLQEHPELNAVVEQDAILVLAEINVGFAVAVAGGLLVPVVHNAASISLTEIAQRTKQLRKRALAGQLRAEDVTGGTATISNLGTYSVDAFTPILNPPESVVLGVGRIAERAIARGGRVVAAPTCVLSLTFDHRVADGVPAAQLLEAVARRMTDPHYFTRLS